MIDVIPPPPKSLPAAEAKIWTEFQRSYYLDGILSCEILEAALQAHAPVRECAAVVKREGLMIEIAAGSHKAHPLLAVKLSARNQFVMLLGKLRLDRNHIELRDPAQVTTEPRRKPKKPDWMN